MQRKTLWILLGILAALCAAASALRVRSRSISALLTSRPKGVSRLFCCLMSLLLPGRPGLSFSFSLSLPRPFHPCSRPV